jgi:anaerobic selenocysteine-containing dehydrogenase
MHDLPVLAEGAWRCTAPVHPIAAARLGLLDGGMAYIHDGARRIEVQVEVSDEMMPGAVSHAPWLGP